MAKEQLISALNNTVAALELENTKKYWMVRTNDGANYNIFSENGFVALKFRNYPTQFLNEIERNYPEISSRLPQIKKRLMDLNHDKVIDLDYVEGEKDFNVGVGRLAKQIATMAFYIKKNDIVLIPDRGANRIKIGRITDDGLIPNDEGKGSFSFSRKVTWLKEITKNRLDPCLYKALGAHQAICDITKYAEYIERNYNSYFALNNKYHYVLAVNAENVRAWQLSNILYDILNGVKLISEDNNLGLDIDDINFTINVNSPGKFSFVTSPRCAVMIMAMVTVFSGGEISYGDLEISTNGCFEALTKCVIEWEKNRVDLEQKQELFEQRLRSLEMQSVEESNMAYELEIKYARDEVQENNPKLQF